MPNYIVMHPDRMLMKGQKTMWGSKVVVKMASELMWKKKGRGIQREKE